MSLTVSDSGSGEFVLVPEGTHVARCVRLIDLGVQPGSVEFPDPKHKVLVAWEIPDELIKFDDEERPALLMQRYTASLHKKSKLRADLESWRGRAFTETELKAFSLKAVLDAPCLLSVVHSQDGKYANVRSVSKLPKGTICPPRINPLMHYEIEDGENTVYLELSEKLRATIDVGRKNYVPAEPQPKTAARFDTRPVEPPPRDYDREKRGGEVRAAAAAAAGKSTSDHPGYFDDSVPF